jgi:hypothetical protein
LLLLRGNGPLGPISRRLLGRRLTRLSQSGLVSRFRRIKPRIARHRLAEMLSHASQTRFASRGMWKVGEVVNLVSFDTTVHDACLALA